MVRHTHRHRNRDSRYRLPDALGFQAGEGQREDAGSFRGHPRRRVRFPQAPIHDHLLHIAGGRGHPLLRTDDRRNGDPHPRLHPRRLVFAGRDMLRACGLHRNVHRSPQQPARGARGDDIAQYGAPSRAARRGGHRHLCRRAFAHRRGAALLAGRCCLRLRQ